jgi:urease accessory protein
MIHVVKPLLDADPALPEVAVRVDRFKLVKRLWRGVAEDGTDFGFEVEKPLHDGDVVHRSEKARYVIRQDPEPLLEISLAIAPSAAAGIGWAIGNLHLELMAEPSRLLTPDDKATRQLLERLRVPFKEITAVFRPGRFARGESSVSTSSPPDQELGQSHKH